MRDSDDENGGFASPLEDSESLTGYESATESNLRRKMEELNTDGIKAPKKLKIEHGTNKTEKRNKEKNKEKDKNKDKSKNENNGNGLFGDGWQKNRVFKTFMIEPKDETSEPIHVMEIARLLRNIKITYQELVKAGKNRFKITFANPRHAEQLINSQVLIDDFKYKIFVPTMFKETIGVIRNVPPSIPESEILANLESERIKITKVERIKKLQKKDLVPTYAIKIYAEGEKLPRQVRIYDLPYDVDCYVFPMKCCVKCVRYGHSFKACKSPKVRCYNCSNEGHEGQDCKSLNVSCWHCKEGHKAFDISCRERNRQDNIRKAMAYNKLTFVEAAKLYPIQSRVQYRIQDNSEFPSLTQPEIQSVNTQTPEMLKFSSNHNQNTQNQPINNSQKNSYTENRNNMMPTDYITKSELDQIVNKLKVEIVKQLNVTKLITKIKEIQESIVQNITKSNEENNQTNNHNLLITISQQLNDIINPEILRNSKPPER